MDAIRVLVVEDDPHLLTGIRDILELEDYSVLTAANGRDGLTVLKADPANPPDVIVSDVMMPYMDGFQFLEEVRKEDAWVRVPFIFLTAKGEKTDRFMGHQLGADRYLTKPFDADDLLVAVSSTLKRHRRIARLAEDEINNSKQKILTILNHEFRTPLTLVVAYADMLKEYDPSTTSADEVLTFLNGVNSGADRLRRLIENFITVVELDTGEADKTIDWRKRPVADLKFLTDDAVRQVKSNIDKNLLFDVLIHQNLPEVNLDVQYMTIAIRELLDNAAKFSEESGTVTLNAFTKEGDLVIEVVDTGRGIPANEFEKIWQPFYQIEREKFEDQGSGSGLAIVKGIVELHGGHCTVKSPPNEGSTFTITVPIKVQEPAIKAEAAS
ncbi:MAG: HAMP domain-containing sensor histidine kinase [Chloroflexota bacterium]